MEEQELEQKTNGCLTKFKCDKCGLCCFFCDKHVNLHTFDRGDGGCVHLSPANECLIYKERPVVCSVEKSFALDNKGMTWTSYCALSEAVCSQLKLLYGHVKL